MSMQTFWRRMLKAGAPLTLLTGLASAAAAMAGMLTPAHALIVTSIAQAVQAFMPSLRELWREAFPPEPGA